MNLREGRIGAQEGASAAGMALGVSAVFVTDGAALYGQGNAAYLTALGSALLSWLVFLLARRAMRRQCVETLPALLCRSLGGALGKLCAALLCGVLVIASAGVLARFVLMLSRFAFVEAAPWLLLVYLAPAAGLLAWMGLETLARTARLFCWLVLGFLLAALLLGLPHYDAFRLLPFPADPERIGGLSLRGTFSFLPALLALLVMAPGLHGERAAGRAGLAAVAFGGGAAALSRFCLGLTYGYDELAGMHSPMYRLTMTARSGGYFPRLDKLLLFGWTAGAALAAGFYQYAAGLLWCRIFNQRDIRPAALMASGLSAAICLLAQRDIPWLQALEGVLSLYGWLLAALPVAAASLIALAHKPAGRAGLAEN